MRSRANPEAAVAAVGVVERQPQPEASLPRFRVEEGAVLVAGHHASDAGLLKDVHALRKHWILVSKPSNQVFHLFGEGIFAEHWVERKT